MRGRPGVPTWLLALLVVLALGTALALFLRDAGEDAEPTRSDDRDRRERAEELLTVPDERRSDDAERRGRERLEAGRGGASREDDAADADDDVEPLPPILGQLRGVRVALAPASGAVSGTATRRVVVAGTRVACGVPANGDADALTAELRQLEALAAVLRRAGAIVDLVGDDDGTVPCVDRRVAAFEAAQLAVVVGSGDVPRALSARAAGTVPPAERRAAAALAADLAGALDAPTPTTRTSRADLQLLARAGAFDTPGGSLTAFVTAPTGERDDTDETALALARGLAVAAARLD